MGRERPLAFVTLALVLALPSRAPASPSEFDVAASETARALMVAAAARGMAVPDPAERSGTLDLRIVLQRYYRSTVGVTLGPGEIADADAALSLPARARDALAHLLDAMTEARALRDRALIGLGPDELWFAHGVGTHGPRSDVEAARAAAIVARIDTGTMLHAAALVQAAATDAMSAFAGLARAEATCLPGNAVCIGSDGPDVWANDVQLLIDPSGDDLYLNNAGGVLPSAGFHAMGGCALGGGTTDKARPNLACTAAPSSVCSYDIANRATGRDDLPVLNAPGHVEPGSGNGNDGSCGNDARTDNVVASLQAIDEDADARGVAVLLDLDGSDTYTVPWSHEDPLFDLIEDCYPGEPDRVNTNRDLFQGGSLSGVSLLWDAGEGDDRYRGRLNAQGSGHVGGVGMLITSGSGDAHFWADRLAQGNGIAGGVGMLVNTKDGEHTYLLDAPLVYRNEFAPNGRRCSQEGRAGQGQGGFGGVGILWTSTQAGDATYRAVSHATTDTHPFAPVLAPDGRPLLVGGGDAQGSGESFPIVDTPGGLVVGAALLYDHTDGDASVCPPLPDGLASAGMVEGSTTSMGIDLSTAGVVDACGTFNMPTELDPAGDLGAAIQHLLAGAVGVRVVTPA